MDDEEENTEKNSSNRKPISYLTEFRLDINLNNFVRKLCSAKMSHTYIQTDRQTDRQADRQTYRPSDEVGCR